MTEAVQAVVGSIMMVGVLICCALLHSMYDLKAALMYVQQSLIQQLMLYKFELGRNAIEAAKNISCVKGESAVDHSTVTGWFKKFHSGCKNLNKQARSGGPKTVDSKAIFEDIEPNLANSTWRVSGKFSISQSSVVHHLHNLSKSLHSSQIVPHVTKILQNF